MAFSLSRFTVVSCAALAMAATTVSSLAEPYQGETAEPYGAAPSHPYDTPAPHAGQPLGSYGQIYVAPVTTDLPEPDIGQITYSERGNRPINEGDLVRKSQDLHDDLVKAFGKRHDIVDAPGPGVLTVSATITELAATRPTQADFERNPRLKFDSVFAGGASFDVQFSENGTPVGAYEKSIFTSFNDGDPRLATWADADRVFWRFAVRLDRYVRKN